METKRVIFCGGGNMATTIIERCVASGILDKKKILVKVKSEAALKGFKSVGFNAFIDFKTVELTQDDIFVIAVKPQSRSYLWTEMHGIRGRCLVSIMAGIGTKVINKELGDEDIVMSGSIVRAFPNIASKIGSGLTLICHDQDFLEIDFVKNLFEAIGKIQIVPEAMFDGAGVLSACVPAWIAVIMEGLIDGGVFVGVPREIAQNVVAEAFQSTAKLALTNMDPSEIKNKVASPDGTTIAGLMELERHAVRGTFMNAVSKSFERAKQME